MPSTIDTAHLHQGRYLDGEKPNRWYVAVILAEEEVQEVLDEINKDRTDEDKIAIDELDLDQIADGYSGAMTEGWISVVRSLLTPDNYRNYLKSKPQ